MKLIGDMVKEHQLRTPTIGIVACDTRIQPLRLIAWVGGRVGGQVRVRVTVLRHHHDIVHSASPRAGT